MRPTHPPAARVASAPFPQAAPGKSHMRVRRTRANSAHSPRYASPRRARAASAPSRKPRPFPRIERRVVKGQLERRRERRIAQQRAVIAIFIVRPRPLRQRVGQQAVKPVPNTNLDISVISSIVSAPVRRSAPAGSPRRFRLLCASWHFPPFHAHCIFISPYRFSAVNRPRPRGSQPLTGKSLFRRSSRRGSPPSRIRTAVRRRKAQSPFRQPPSTRKQPARRKAQSHRRQSQPPNRIANKSR